jgi:hypothetical protein
MTILHAKHDPSQFRLPGADCQPCASGLIFRASAHSGQACCSAREMLPQAPPTARGYPEQRARQRLNWRSGGPPQARQPQTPSLVRAGASGPFCGADGGG